MRSAGTSEPGPRTATSTRLPEIDRKAEERLRASSYLALRDISCLASHDVLYLYGRLRSHYLKQVAQELASGVEGVRHVVNRIRSRRTDEPGAIGPRNDGAAVGQRRATTTIFHGEGGPPRSHNR